MATLVVLGAGAALVRTPAAGAAPVPALVKTVATNSVVDTGNTLTLTVTGAGVVAGDTLVVVGSKGRDAETLASVADSAGNAYSLDLAVHGGAGGNLALGVAHGYVANGLVAGDTITLTYEGAAGYTNRFGAAYEFSGIAPAAALDASASRIGTYGTSVSSGVTPATTQAQELVFGLFNLQSLTPGFIAAGAYAALPPVSGGVAGQTLQAVYQPVAALGTQEATGSLSSLQSWDGLIVTYKAGDPTGVVAPANTAAPVVAGTPWVGSALTVSNGTWSGTRPLAFTYRWQRCTAPAGPCVDIGGANLAAYTVAAGDTGFFLRAIVTASNGAGAGSSPSAATTVVTASSFSTPAFVKTIDNQAVLDGANDTLTLTVPAGGVPIGDTVFVVAAKGREAQAVLQVTDSRGNAYTVDRNVRGSAGSNLGAGLASAFVTTALVPGDTISVEYEGGVAYTNRWGAAYEFSGLAAGGADAAASAAGYGRQVASGSTPATLQDVELVFGLFDIQSTAPAFVPAAGFTALAPSTGASAGQVLQPEFAVVNAKGTQQAAGGLGPITSWIGLAVTYRALSSAPPTPPVNVALPGIGGAASAKDGVALTTTNGTWSGTTPFAFTYQWRRCNGTGGACGDIGGANAATYIPAPADVGSTLRVVVTATNTAGFASATSAQTAVVAAAAPANTVLPSVAGDPRDGAMLSASPGTWTGTPPLNIGYVWQRCDVAGANCVNLANTSTTLVVATGDIGLTFRVVVTATNTAGQQSATSAATATVVAAGYGGPTLVKAIGPASVTNGTNNTLTLTVPAGGVAAGDTIVVVAGKGVDGQAIASVADTGANVWSVNLAIVGPTGSNHTAGVASAYVTNPLAAGDTITVTYQGATSFTNRFGIAYDFKGLAPAPAFDVSARANGNTRQLSGGVTPATAQANELVLGVFNTQGMPSLAGGPGFTALPGADSAAVANQSLRAVYAVVWATGPQEARATAAAFVSYTGATLTFKAAGVPVNTVAPVIAGVPADGATLTADTGTWTTAGPTTYASQWQRCDGAGANCIDLIGMTAATYTPFSADVGSTIRVVVTTTNGAGSAKAASAATAPVAATALDAPPVTAGLQLWFDASTENLADGAAVTTWHDRSGNGRDLTAGFSNQVAVIRRAVLNGRAAVEFDGVTDELKTYGSTFTIAQPSTFFIVYKALDADNPAVRNFVFDSRDSSARQVFGRPANGTVRMYANSDLDFLGFPYPFASFGIWSGKFQDVTSDLYRNGVLVGGGYAGFSALTGFAVGGLSTDGPGAYDLGHSQICEILYYAGALSPTDRAAVTAWLDAKYAVY